LKRPAAAATAWDIVSWKTRLDSCLYHLKHSSPSRRRCRILIVNSTVVRNEFPDKEIAVWAAGGIADGRGVAAALALGAEAAVLGTRVCRGFFFPPLRYRNGVLREV
jgi:hypothetical protein